MDSVTGLVILPRLPEPWIWTLAGLTLVVAALGLWRRARGAWLRLVPLATLVVLLINPQWTRESREPLDDIALVVVDDSASQRLAGRTEETAAALAALQDALAALPGLSVRVVRVGDEVTAGSAGGAGGGAAGAEAGTHLLSATARALADIPRAQRAGVFLVTDGLIHDPQALGDPAGPGGPGAPVHLLLTGDPDQRDRVLIVNEAPSFGLVGQTVTLSVTLEDPALAVGTKVPVTLRADHDRVERRHLPANQPAEITLPLTHPGPTVVSLEAPAVAGEAATLNNRVALAINGVRDRLTVLLVSGQPHVGERVWRDLLKGDPAVDLIHFTILRPPSKEDLTPLSDLALIAFPTRTLFEEKIKGFDLIIFDRYVRRGLVPESYLANIARAVEEGGALLLSVGPEYTRPNSLADSVLAGILPATPTGSVTETRFRPRLSAVGHRHPVTAGLPGAGREGTGGSGTPAWGDWLRRVDLARPAGQVVMTGPDPDSPLLILDRVGAGRVALLASDTLWLWAKGWEGGGPHGELLRRLAHWLMKEPALEEEALTARIDGGTMTVDLRSLGDLPASVRVFAPDDTTAEVPLGAAAPGRATATWPAPLPGVYGATLADGRQVLAVSGPPNPPETTRVVATATRLAPLAAATGGAVVWLREAGMPRLRRVAPDQPTRGPGWAGVVETGAHVVSGVTLSPVLPAPLALALILGGLALAWAREGR